MQFKLEWHYRAFSAFVCLNWQLLFHYCSRFLYFFLTISWSPSRIARNPILTKCNLKILFYYKIVFTSTGARRHDRHWALSSERVNNCSDYALIGQDSVNCGMEDELCFVGKAFAQWTNLVTTMATMFPWRALGANSLSMNFQCGQLYLVTKAKHCQIWIHSKHPLRGIVL